MKLVKCIWRTEIKGWGERCATFFATQEELQKMGEMFNVMGQSFGVKTCIGVDNNSQTETDAVKECEACRKEKANAL